MSDINTRSTTDETQREGGGDEPPGRRRSSMLDWFGGSTGTALVAKIVGLAIADALAIYGALTLWSFEAWGMLAALVAFTVLINWAYLSRKTIAAKYLVPGLIFLIIYQVFVVVYSFGLSFTNFGDGNNDTKEQAINTLLAVNETRVPDSPSFPAQVVESGGELGFLTTNPETGEQAVGFADQPLEPTEAADFTTLTFAEIAARQDEVFELRVPISEDPADGSLRTTDGSTVFVYESTLEYDEAADAMIDTQSGEVYVADGEIGAFVNPESGQRLNPGWQVFVGFENYTRLLTDERIRTPFISVFIWNFVFATLSVIGPLAIGLSAALVMDHRGMRFTRAYRALMILPYAIPSFLTTLVWQGMLNTDFGFINQVLLGGASIPWLSDPWLARLTVIFVQLWLGFPYFLIVSTGALTSIPDDVKEAAKMDGANGWQTFWQIKFPLLMIAIAPLTIASFAFNFNNYNTIRFLTDGGPTDVSAAVSVGATDILITFVDKLAFAGAVRQYGFASAIAVVIFIVVAGLSYFGFRRARTFEEIKD